MFVISDFKPMPLPHPKSSIFYVPYESHMDECPKCGGWKSKDRTHSGEECDLEVVSHVMRR